MGTRIKIKRGSKEDIIANKDTLEENEIVYSTDYGMLGIKSNGIDTSDGIVWFLPKEADNIELGYGANGTDYCAITIGETSFTASDSAIALGTNSSVGASSIGSIAIGLDAAVLAGTFSVSNDKAIAIGCNAAVNSNGGIALGSNSVVASNPYAIVMGRDSSSASDYSAEAEGASIVIGGNSNSGVDGKNIIIGSKARSADASNIVIGNNVYAEAGSLIIGHDNEVSSVDAIVIGHGAAAAGDNDNHVQLGNSSFTSGNIGNKPIDLQGDLEVYPLTSSLLGARISLSDMFANKPVGTVALLFFNGELISSSDIEYGFRIMQNDSTPITSFYRYGAGDYDSRFTCTIIKTDDNELTIHAYKGNVFTPSENTLNITYDKPDQTMTLIGGVRGSRIEYGRGLEEGERNATLRVKFI